MTPGEVLLGLALLAAILAVWPSRHRAFAARAHAILLALALALLVVDLLGGALRYQYAWAHARVEDPWIYRLAGVWGGEEGTVLVWNLAVALVAAKFARPRDALDRRAGLLLVTFSGALTFFALLFGLFEPTRATALASAPGGRGLAEVLLTPLMVVHPPVQFVAYALMSVPAAYAIASLWEPERDGAWAGRALPWARLAWFFATLGLALGALWAYYVLSFGGYWAWDPVETSNLLPWLALTTFLHAGKLRARGQGHVVSSLVLAYGAFLLTLFATFATRSGLWVSVHAFTDPTDRFEPDAPARLLAILDAHLPTRAFLGLLTAALLLGVALWIARRHEGVAARAYAALLFALAGAALVAPADAWGVLFAAGALVLPAGIGAGLLLGALVAGPFVVAYARADESGGRFALDRRALITGAVLLLGLALAVVFFLGLQIVNGPDRGVFDRRAPFVAIPIALLLCVMLGQAPLGTRGALVLAGGGLVGGLAAAWAFPATRVLALTAPVALAATAAALLHLVHLQGRGAPLRLRVAGALLLVAGLLGILFASNPPTDLGPFVISNALGAPLAMLGIALSTCGILGAIAAFREASRAWAIAGALAAILAIGYGVGAILALAALALLARAPFPPGRSLFGSEGVRIRETGIHLVHLAVILGMLGFAASTYAQAREVHAGVPLDAVVGVGDHTIALADPAIQVDAQGLVALAVGLDIAKEGERVGRESLEFRWQPQSGVYAGRLEVRRGLFEDVYLTPMAFHTPEGWVGADSAAGGQVRDPKVDAVSFSVSIVPLMGLVWGSGALFLVGMGMILAARGRQA